MVIVRYISSKSCWPYLAPSPRSRSQSSLVTDQVRRLPTFFIPGQKSRRNSRNPESSLKTAGVSLTPGSSRSSFSSLESPHSSRRSVMYEESSTAGARIGKISSFKVLPAFLHWSRKWFVCQCILKITFPSRFHPEWKPWLQALAQ